MEDEVTPTTRTAHVQWRPRPAFYDLRGSFAQALDDVFGVQQFMVGDHEISARLANGMDVVVDPARLGIFSVDEPDRRSGQVDDLNDLADLVITLLDAKVSDVRFSYQHLVPWRSETTLQAAYNAAVDATVGESVRASMRLTDMALLLDGKRADGGEYQVEFGVIDAEQAPLRLLRRAGRLTSMQPSSPESILTLQFAPVSTFCDSTWMHEVDQSAAGDLQSVLRSQQQASEAEANGLAVSLHKMMIDQSNVVEGARV